MSGLRKVGQDGGDDGCSGSGERVGRMWCSVAEECACEFGKIEIRELERKEEVNAE